MLIETFSSGEIIKIPGTNSETRRLVGFQDFSRYYPGVGDAAEPCK